MIELIVAGVGIVAALIGVGFSLTRRREPDVAVLESSQRRTSQR